MCCTYAHIKFNLIESAFKFLNYVRSKRKERGREKRKRKQVLLILYVNQSYLITFHSLNYQWYQNCNVFTYNNWNVFTYNNNRLKAASDNYFYFAGSHILLEKLRKYKPKIAVFNGKLIYEVFSGKKEFGFGRQPNLVEGTNTVKELTLFLCVLALIF